MGEDYPKRCNMGCFDLDPCAMMAQAIKSGVVISRYKRDYGILTGAKGVSLATRWSFCPWCGGRIHDGREGQE